MKKKNIGSTLDSWLREEGLFEKVNTSATNRSAAGQDLERINRAADELNSEALDVLRYQALDDFSVVEKDMLLNPQASLQTPKPMRRR